MNAPGAEVDMVEARHAAARIAARAEIQDVRLLSSAIEVHKLPEPGKELGYTLNAEPAVEHGEDNDFFVVTAQYSLKITQPNEPTENEDTEKAAIIADINFKFASLFSLAMRKADDPPAKDELLAYGQSTGHLALHPYAREYVYNMTGRLGLPPLTIGVLQHAYNPKSES